MLFRSSLVRFDEHRIHAAAVYCSDGRFGDQFDDFLHHALGLPRYDRLALPGGAACLASHFLAFHQEENLIEQLRFLVAVHQLERVVLIAHQDCAFYTQRLKISPERLESQQRDDVQDAIERIRWFASELQVDAFFARKLADGVIRFESLKAWMASTPGPTSAARPGASLAAEE